MTQKLYVRFTPPPITLLSPPTDLPAMIEASAKLLEQVTAQQAAAGRLSELSVACGGEPLALPELDQLAEEAGLKAVLWAMQEQLRGAAATWLTGPVFELDVADMQFKVGVHAGSLSLVCSMRGET